MGIVEEEVSREAAQAYTAEGASLYDSIRMVSRDAAMTARLLAEAEVLVLENCNRFITTTTETPETPTTPANETGNESGNESDASLSFILDLSTRRGEGKQDILARTLTNVMAKFVINRFLLSKNMNDLAAKYQALALADVQTMSRLLYTKNPPKYPTIDTNDDDKDSNSNPA